MLKVNVKDTEITVIKFYDTDFISLTDIAKFKSEDPNSVIANWLRNRNTVEYLGIWEILYNPDFKPLEFEGFRKEAGLNAFILSPTKWVATTNAKGIIVRSGRYGGTYARKDIAFQMQVLENIEERRLLTDKK
ncbi:KilA-N domain-containing protein [bacterium]|nr:KilA-N domain-containing protein [bacterium]